MKWVKFLKEDNGRKAGEIVQIDDAEHGFLLARKFVEDAPEPKEVADAGSNAEVATSAREAVEGILGEFRKTLATTAKAEGRKPFIQVGADRELEDPTDGFKSFGEYMNCVRKSCSHNGTDERLTRRAKATSNSENVNGDGGYIVPVQYAEGVWSDVQELPSLMNDCYLIPMSGNSVRIPAVNSLTQGDAAGVTALWEGEKQPIPTSGANFRQPQLTLNKLTVGVRVSDELLEDAPACEAILQKMAGEAITYKLNDAIFNGTGAGMPRGIIVHPSVATVGRQTNGTFTAQDAIKLKARMLKGMNAKTPKFYANQDVDPALYTIQDGAGRYLYFAPGTFAQSPDGKLLGYDHVTLINCQSLGTPGDVVLADLSQYAFGYKTTGVKRAMSIHLYFATDETAYRWTFRADGRPMRDAPIAAAKGNATYSPFVVLQ